jgi:hypothetical protein
MNLASLLANKGTVKATCQYSCSDIFNEQRFTERAHKIVSARKKNQVNSKKDYEPL